MAHPLDGLAFYAYCRRLRFGKKTQDLLETIRSSPPSRTPGARRGNMPIWYPSKRMQCIIKAESAKVEFAFLLQAEHDDDVLEIWDQPPSIPLEYLDRRKRIQRPNHTADYFVFRSRTCGWIECKPTAELIKQSVTRPNRYLLDEQGHWRCPPGEAFAQQYGLTYSVWSSDQIRWPAQDNWLYLEDYYQDLERLVVPEEVLDSLRQNVKAHPGILLDDLRAATPDIPSDFINIAIARHALYVDLATYRLSDLWHTPVFPDRPAARATTPSSSSVSPISQGEVIAWNGVPWHIAALSQTEISFTRDECDPLTLSLETVEALVSEGKMVRSEHKAPSSFTPEGQALLEQARDVDSATAVFRNRIINPDQYGDDEQAEIAEQAATVPARTKRRWRKFYRDAEIKYGSGFIGLLPHSSHCGPERTEDFAPRNLIHEVLETHYDTVARKPKRGAYGEYLLRAKERQLPPLSPRTFYREVERHKTVYEQTLAREGSRAAYPFKDYVREPEKTVNRHGDYAWAMAHLDHTELDLILCDSRTNQPLGKCWLTLLILSHPRRIASYYLTFDPPSYRSCMMALRLCVKRYERLPTAITVDGGPEFHSIYFEQLLALYRVRKHQRPAAEPRYSSPQERLFGTMDTSFIYHLMGNTQATRDPRLSTKATDPERLAVWTLPKLAEQVQRWADEEYDTIRHPALGMTPRDAYELSMKRDGERTHKHIEYDDAFLKATFPTTRQGKATVEPSVGVRMNYLEYWCEAMRDVTVEKTQVKVRYDSFDVSIGYAYIDGQWRKCDCPYTEFAGCSERELQLLTEELRRRNRLQYGREQIEISQEQLATFRRDNVEIEKLLRQQRNDRETKAAFVVLEGGRKKVAVSKSAPMASPNISPPGPSENKLPSNLDTPEKKPGKLLVFRRISS